MVSMGNPPEAAQHAGQHVGPRQAGDKTEPDRVLATN
jgi:hypothetical protein